VTSTATIGDVAEAMEALYPAGWAEPGDPVGLVVGDPAAAVHRVLFAVDPVQAVADQAVASGADLLVVHHPLLFRAVHSVAASTPKGRVVHDLVTGGVGLFVAHTNADSAIGGVSESLALTLGLLAVRPLGPAAEEPLDKVVTFVPADSTDDVIDALAAAGAGRIGAYDRCAFVSEGTGTFRPGEGARPAIGTAGRVEVVDERRVEMVLRRARRADVVSALRAAHPYEEPAFDVVELAAWPAARGTGRIGRLARPTALRDFADHVTAALPATAVGARVAGDLDARVETVAVLGGAGDFMLDAARASGCDVYLTSDLRHHPASELREYGAAPALIDVPHWAAEWTWLPRAARALAAHLTARGMSVVCDVSQICTDPWNHCTAPDRRSAL
jgi:dinuclear metal center YbgI/SA1388 family protein